MIPLTGDGNSTKGDVAANKTLTSCFGGIKSVFLSLAGVTLPGFTSKTIESSH